jgi:NADH-quinone oxidoreductase subunit N
MSISDFLMMRQELILAIVALLVLIVEIILPEEKKKSIIPVALSLFAIVTIVGFIPGSEGKIFGGMYQTSMLIIMMKNVLNIGLLIVLMQSAGWLGKEENEGKIGEYFILLFTTVIGMDYMISAGDFLMFYIGLELATIPATALAAYDKSRNQSAEAGIKFILSSALSTGILLYGISMIYGSTGSIYFMDVATSFGNNGLQILGLLFYVAGMGFKISLVPFHLWTADVYEGSPVNITSYLSVISKAAAVFILAIMLFTVFRYVESTWEIILYVLAVLTMTIANLFALRQNNLKRFLAFSSIAQAGFILLGIMGANAAGMTSVVYFMLVYVFTNLGAFGVVSVISNLTGKENIPDYNGLYRTNPLLSLTMMLSLFSLAGIPPVAGFFGKFLLFASAASKGYYILVLIAVLNATISLYYYLRVVKAMFIDKSENPIPYFNSDMLTKLSLIICVAGVFLVGFFSLIYEYIFKISGGVS